MLLLWARDVFSTAHQQLLQHQALLPTRNPEASLPSSTSLYLPGTFLLSLFLACSVPSKHKSQSLPPFCLPFIPSSSSMHPFPMGSCTASLCPSSLPRCPSRATTFLLLLFFQQNVLSPSPCLFPFQSLLWRSLPALPCCFSTASWQHPGSAGSIAGMTQVPAVWWSVRVIGPSDSFGLQ